MNVKPTNRFEGKIQFRHSGGLLLMMDEFYDCNLFYVYGGESPPGGQATGAIGCSRGTGSVQEDISFSAFARGNTLRSATLHYAHSRNNLLNEQQRKRYRG